MKRLILCLIILCTGLTWSCSDRQDKRSADTLLIDRGEVLGNISETLNRRLAVLRSDHGIEVVLASVDSLPPDETIRELAARLFSQWDIGRDSGGQGLLLLLAVKEKEVRLEVGMSLEGVFTDLFTGHIENKQLISYFLSGQLETGLIAVLEEIEARAALLAVKEASAEKIHGLDMARLSAGGGADVALAEYERIFPATVPPSSYPAGQTADEAWQTLLQSWRDKNRAPNIGVYTPVTRLIYRDFVNQPDSRFNENVRTWAYKPYRIIEDGDHAVIFFGTEKGWDNAPFLFCRTKEGWQFDMVHQRKIVRMGRAPKWGIERGEHPYIKLLSDCPYWMGQDIPTGKEDTYSVYNDTTTAEKIVALERRLKHSSEDFDTLYELGRLYTLASMCQKRFALLEKALRLNPGHPGAIKCLAMAHVDAHYQYPKASELMNTYVKRAPADSFGHFFLGYLHLMNKEYDKAITSLNRGVGDHPGQHLWALQAGTRLSGEESERGPRARGGTVVAGKSNRPRSHPRSVAETIVQEPDPTQFSLTRPRHYGFCKRF